MVLAIVFSAMLANGLSAPQHSIVFVIFDEDRDRPACTPNFGTPLLSSELPCGPPDGLERLRSPLRLDFCGKENGRKIR